MQKRNDITCAGCAKQIIGEYIIRKKNGGEEYFHSRCARSAGQMKLPVQIRFTEDETKK